MSIVMLRNEYSPADKEAAYEIYKDPSRGGRSLRKTSRLTDIPFGTLAYWNRTLGWQQRIWEEDSREAAVIEQTVKLRLVNELDGLMDHLIHLAYNARPEDRVQADTTKHLLSIASFSAVQKVQQDITQAVTVSKPAGETEEKLAARTSDDLAKLVNEKIKALMSGGENEKNEGIPTEGRSREAGADDPDRGGEG